MFSKRKLNGNFSLKKVSNYFRSLSKSWPFFFKETSSGKRFILSLPLLMASTYLLKWLLHKGLKTFFTSDKMARKMLGRPSKKWFISIRRFDLLKRRKTYFLPTLVKINFNHCITHSFLPHYHSRFKQFQKCQGET